MSLVQPTRILIVGAAGASTRSPGSSRPSRASTRSSSRRERRDRDASRACAACRSIRSIRRGRRRRRASAVELVVDRPGGAARGGVADALATAGIAVFGPTRGAPGSRARRRSVGRWPRLPASRWRAGACSRRRTHRRRSRMRWGLHERRGRRQGRRPRGGKGVTVCSSLDEAAERSRAARLDRRRGAARRARGERDRAVRRAGPRVGLPISRDHKRLGDGDVGPITGGMGAYSPLEDLPDAEVDAIIDRSTGRSSPSSIRAARLFAGALYAGLMLTADGPRCSSATPASATRDAGDPAAARRRRSGRSCSRAAAARSPRLGRAPDAARRAVGDRPRRGGYPALRGAATDRRARRRREPGRSSSTPATARDDGGWDERRRRPDGRRARAGPRGAASAPRRPRTRSLAGLQRRHDIGGGRRAGRGGRVIRATRCPRWARSGRSAPLSSDAPGRARGQPRPGARGVGSRGCARAIEAAASVDPGRIAEIEKTDRPRRHRLRQPGRRDGRAGRPLLHLGPDEQRRRRHGLALQLRDAGSSAPRLPTVSCRTLIARARSEADTLMMGRTHSVHAEPITFGLKLAGWAFEVDRGRRRLARPSTRSRPARSRARSGRTATSARTSRPEVLAELGLHATRPAPRSSSATATRAC
jgi:hypothetical protein